MKHILYVSSLNQEAHGPLVPRHLLEIYESAKHNNRKHNITGILAYKAGYYIQVIEGPDKNVDTLFRNILRDKRHTDIQVLIDRTSSTRYFRMWGFESSLDLSCSPDFAKFAAGYQEDLSSAEHSKRIILSKFYQPEFGKQDRGMCFKKAKLRLKRWPELSDTAQTPQIVHLCTNLLHKTWRYEDLITLCDTMLQKELNNLLKEFRQQQVLRVIRPDNNDDFTGTGSSTMGVYQKLRSILAGSSA